MKGHRGIIGDVDGTCEITEKSAGELHGVVCSVGRDADRQVAGTCRVREPTAGNHAIGAKVNRRVTGTARRVDRDVAVDRGGRNPIHRGGIVHQQRKRPGEFCRTVEFEGAETQNRERGVRFENRIAAEREFGVGIRQARGKVLTERDFAGEIGVAVTGDREDGGVDERCIPGHRECGLGVDEGDGVIAFCDEVVEGDHGGVIEAKAVARGDSGRAVEADRGGVERREVDRAGQKVHIVKSEDVIGDGTAGTRKGLRSGRIEEAVEVESAVVRVPGGSLAGSRVAVDLNEAAVGEDRATVGREAAVDLNEAAAGEIEGQAAVGDHVDVEGEAAGAGVDDGDVEGDGGVEEEREGAVTTEDNVKIVAVGQSADSNDVVRDVDWPRPEDREDIDGVPDEVVARIHAAPTTRCLENRVTSSRTVIDVLPGGGERHAPDRGKHRGGSESWETADTSVGGESGGIDRLNAGQHAGIP